jgi:plasmid stability protein
LLYTIDSDLLVMQNRRMTETKKPLREALNLRIDDSLASEIERIAARHGRSASEVARTLLTHGVQVDRQLEAQELRRHFEADYSDVAGRIVIEAKFEPYTWAEAYQMREDAEARREPLPTWDDLIP